MRVPFFPDSATARSPVWAPARNTHFLARPRTVVRGVAATAASGRHAIHTQRRSIAPVNSTPLAIWKTCGGGKRLGCAIGNRPRIAAIAPHRRTTSTRCSQREPRHPKTRDTSYARNMPTLTSPPARIICIKTLLPCILQTTDFKTGPARLGWLEVLPVQSPCPMPCPYPSAIEPLYAISA